MTSITTHYLLTYLKALGLIGVLFFGVHLMMFAHFECLGRYAGFIPINGRFTVPIMCLFILSKAPSLYWLGRWLICVPWIFFGWTSNMDPSSRPDCFEWVLPFIATLTLAVFVLTLAHRLARDSSRPGASSLSAKIFLQSPAKTEGADLGESIKLRRRRREDLSFLLLSVFIFDVWGHDRSLQSLIYSQLLQSYSILYPLTVIFPLFLCEPPLKTMDGARTAPSTRQLIAYGLTLTLATGLILVAVFIGKHYPPLPTGPLVPYTLFIFFVPFIFSSVFALSMNFFGCTQLRFTSTLYPPHRYWYMTFAYVTKSFAFATLYFCVECWYHG